MQPSRRTGIVVVLLGVSALGWLLGAQRRPTSESVQVSRAIDGDTIVVRAPNGHTDTVRILGVDTPETHHPRKPVQCFGPEGCGLYRAAADRPHRAPRVRRRRS
jgi:micrococcal nuclease